jgi:hypothetical protein
MIKKKYFSYILNKNKNPFPSMSRIEKPIIWNECVGNDIDKIECMCCQKVTLHRLPILGSYDWVKGHIIPSACDPKDNRKPGDFVENLQPICEDCNNKDKKFPTNFHYRVHLGLMTIEDCEERLEKIRTIVYGPVRRCNGLKRNKEKCMNIVHGKQIFCGSHVQKAKTHCNNYVLEQINKDIVKYKKALKQALKDEDDTEVKMLDDILYDLRELKILC